MKVKDIRVVDVAEEIYSGHTSTHKELNEYKLQLKIDEDLLKLVATNRGCAIYIFNNEKKWTELKSFNDFRYGFQNIPEKFLDETLKYISSFYNEPKLKDTILKLSLRKKTFNPTKTISILCN